MPRFTFAVLAASLAVAAAFTGDTYEEKAKTWKNQNSKEEFIRSFNKQHKANLKAGRADRLYRHIVSLLDTKAARFTDNGLTYYLPLTHHFTFLPDPIADGIEYVCTFLRKGYYLALEKVHAEALEHHHNFFEWMNDSGTVNVLMFLCASYLVVAVFSWFINRFTDGIWPSERALAKETRRRAQEYIARKRE